MVVYVENTEEWNKIANLHLENNSILVVCFSAIWCGPCKALKSKYEQLDTEYDDRVVFLKIDIDKCEEVAEKFNIASVPTTLVIKKCAVKDTVVGADILGIKIAIDKNL